MKSHDLCSCECSSSWNQVIAEMTNGVDRSVECTGCIQAMISTFECVHDVNPVNKWVSSVSGLGCCRACWHAEQGHTFKTHPMNILNERTLKGTFFGNCTRPTEEKYMSKVRSCCHTASRWCISFSRKPRGGVHGFSQIIAGTVVEEVHHPLSCFLGDQQGIWVHAAGRRPPTG